MMSKNSIVPFLKDYLIKFLTRPFLLDTNVFDYEKYFPSNKMCAHSVIGQEFNNVAIVIDEHFKYTKNGKLTASNQYYSQRQMLYQIITRARKRLHIIVVNNASMLARCIEILNK